jgi:hypothetical protein
MTPRHLPLAAAIGRCLAGFSAAIALSACYQPPSALHHLTPLAAPADCPYGNPYLEVLNPTNESFDLFARTSSGGSAYIGTVSPTTSRVEIAGTPLEHSAALPTVVPTRQLANDGHTVMLAQRVQLARKCDGPAK